MNNVTMAIKALDGQCVRLDLSSYWPNGYNVQRVLIGTLSTKDDVFIVEEPVGKGKIMTVMPYHQARWIRVDNDSGDGFRAVIQAYDGKED